MAKKRMMLKKPYVAAIVAAAGSATRMNGLDKQFEEIGEVPVIVHSMLALSKSDWIDEMVIVVKQEDIADLFDLIRVYQIPKVRSVVAGGATRQQSVKIGVNAASEQTQYIAVHDGARPFVSQQVIADAVLDAVRHGAATAAVPVVDTIKMADEDGKITSTPDRNLMFAVQTPQVFQMEDYREAIESAQKAGKDYTDDCQMLEAIGRPVYLSHGDYANVKITTPADLIAAQAMAQEQEDYNGLANRSWL